MLGPPAREASRLRVQQPLLTHSSKALTVLRCIATACFAHVTCDILAVTYPYVTYSCVAPLASTGAPRHARVPAAGHRHSADLLLNPGGGQGAMGITLLERPPGG